MSEEKKTMRDLLQEVYNNAQKIEEEDRRPRNFDNARRPISGTSSTNTTTPISGSSSSGTAPTSAANDDVPGKPRPTTGGEKPQKGQTPSSRPASQQPVGRSVRRLAPVSNPSNLTPSSNIGGPNPPTGAPGRGIVSDPPGQAGTKPQTPSTGSRIIAGARRFAGSVLGGPVGGVLGTVAGATPVANAELSPAVAAAQRERLKADQRPPAGSTPPSSSPRNDAAFAASDPKPDSATANKAALDLATSSDSTKPAPSARELENRSMSDLASYTASKMRDQDDAEERSSRSDIGTAGAKAPLPPPRPAARPAAPRPAARPAAPSPKPTAPAPDPNATSRAMFQRASDKGDDATSADFFAADAQRTRELRSQRTNEGTTMKSPMIEAFLKLQEKNSYNLFAEAKKKRLDPVGKEDDDIDNDGDSDKTDSYLRNRRAAIGKAIKEASDDEVNAIIRGVPGQKNKERESSSKDDINSAKASKPERKDNDSEKPAKSSSAPSIKPGDQTMVGQDDDKPEPAKKTVIKPSDQTMVGQDDDNKPEPAKKPVIKPRDQTIVGQDDDKPEPAKKPATPERSQAFRDLTRKHDEDPEFRYTELELDQMRDQIKKLPKDEQTAFIVRQLTPRPSVVKKYGMGRKVDESREDRRSAHPDFAAPGDPRAPKYKDEIEYKKDNETKFPDHPMPPRRPKNLRNESRINEQGVEVISANDPRTKNYAIPKSDVGTFPAPQSDRDNEKKEKYTNRAPSERPYGDLQGAKKAMAKEEISFSRAELEHFAYILEMSVAPTPDDYSGPNNGPSKRDLSDETIVETKKKDPSQLQKRGRKAGVKVGSYKMKGMDDVEADEHKAEPKNLVAQNPRTYSKEGRNLVDLEHPSKPGVKRTVPAKEYNSFRSSYLNAEKPEHKTRMHDDYVKRVFN
jgi:hypothetical protein